MPEVVEYDNKTAEREEEAQIEEEFHERSQPSGKNSAAQETLVKRITLLENELAEAKQRLDIGSDLLQTLFKQVNEDSLFLQQNFDAILEQNRPKKEQKARHSTLSK